MIAIRIVSWIHGLWGLTILLLPLFGLQMPRPFGSLEAYLTYMPLNVMATVFVASAVLAKLSVRRVIIRPRLALAATIPQQLILLWGAIWSILVFAHSVGDGHADIRTLLGCDYLVVLAMFHAFGVRDLWTFVAAEHK